MEFQSAAYGGYNSPVRLFVTLLWLIAAVCWLPWFTMVLALLIDIARGTPWDYSNFVPHALMGFWPLVGMDLLTPTTWLRWQIVSVYPICAFIGVALSAAGWRLYWREQDGLLTRPAWLVGWSIAAPVVAPFLMWGDARQRHQAKELELETEVLSARQRAGAE